VKILFYSYLKPRSTDGASNSGWQLIDNLRKVGCDVTPITTDWSWDDNEGREWKLRGLRIFHSWFGFKLEWSPSLVWWFWKNRNNYDVLFIRGYYSLAGLISALVAWFAGIPVVFSPLGNHPPTWKKALLIPRGLFKQVYFSFLAGPILRLASAIVFASEEERAYFAPYFGANRLYVVPNGINLAEYIRDERLTDAALVGQAAPYILFLGRISPEKGLDFLIRLMPALLHSVPQVSLVVAGAEDLGTSLKKELRQLAANLGVSERVKFEGPVQGEKKRALLQFASCLVLPSLRESFGNVVLEALALGTVPVVSDKTPWQSLEGEKMGHCLPLNATVWKETLVSLLNGGPTESFYESARSWLSANFTWEQSADKLWSIFNLVNRDHLKKRPPVLAS
jgi:glycosyltransferase involved in cell wall biosynthesis